MQWFERREQLRSDFFRSLEQSSGVGLAETSGPHRPRARLSGSERAHKSSSAPPPPPHLFSWPEWWRPCPRSHFRSRSSLPRPRRQRGLRAGSIPCRSRRSQSRRSRGGAAGSRPSGATSGRRAPAAEGGAAQGVHGLQGGPFEGLRSRSSWEYKHANQHILSLFLAHSITQ